MTGKTVLTIFLAVTAAVPFLSAQQKDAIRYYEELIGNMTRQVRLLQDENARLDAKVNELQQNQAELVRSNKRLLEEMDEIRELVRNDASAREKELRKLSGQLDKLANMPPPAPPKPPAQPKRKELRPVDSAVSGTFEEFEVPRGATLSAIAQAFQTTVSEIMRINNLKNDRLRVGQKLLVPVKGK